MGGGIARRGGQGDPARAAASGEDDRRDRLVTIAGAVLLSVVTVLAAWSGYAAAKWSTDSRVSLAEATTLRVRANRAESKATALRNFDSSTFEAWFAAYVAGNRGPCASPSIASVRSSRSHSTPGARRTLSRTPTLPPARPMCPNTGSRASRPRVHSTSKQAPPSERARSPGPTPTSTCSSPSSSQASSSWWGSRRNLR